MTIDISSIFATDTPNDPAAAEMGLESPPSLPHWTEETHKEFAERFHRGDIDISYAMPFEQPGGVADAPEVGRPPWTFNCSESAAYESAYDRCGGLRQLCSPPAKPRDPDCVHPVLTTCDRCGSTEFVDVPIHNGQSTRRECAKCRRFIDFPNWYGLDK